MSVSLGIRGTVGVREFRGQDTRNSGDRGIQGRIQGTGYEIKPEQGPMTKLEDGGSIGKT